jgi:hypothetical protein
MRRAGDPGRLPGSAVRARRPLQACSQHVQLLDQLRRLVHVDVGAQHQDADRQPFELVVGGAVRSDTRRSARGRQLTQSIAGAWSRYEARVTVRPRRRKWRGVFRSRERLRQLLEASADHVPHSSPDHARATSMPDTRLANRQAPARLVRSSKASPVSMSPKSLDTSSAVRSRSPS